MLHCAVVVASNPKAADPSGEEKLAIPLRRMVAALSSEHEPESSMKTNSIEFAIVEEKGAWNNANV